MSVTLQGLLDASTKIVAFTGAGISTESGLPDFRGPNGVWTKDPVAAETFNIYSFKAKERVRDNYWSSRLGMMGEVQANEGHKALARLHEVGKLHGVITQNIDGLHQAAGVPGYLVHELHGSLSHVKCWGCGFRVPMKEFLDLSTEPPWKPSTYRCPKCRKLFKPDVVLFGEELDEVVWDKAVEAILTADLVLALGSSLSVFPAAGLVGIAAKSDTPVVIVNNEATDYDDEADLIVRASIGETLASVIP